MSLTPGHRLGPYEIVEPIGKGGMGEVYVATDTRLDRKVLRHHLGALVKEGRLERIGVGRHAIYSSL